VTCVAIVPAHDEAERIAQTVRATLSVPGIDRVLVVDDGSSDDTADEAMDAGAEVLRLSVNRGKGAALEAGVSLLPDDAEVVLFLDADLGASAAEAAALLEPVRAGEADMSIATFPAPARPAGFGIVLRLARWGIRRYGGLEVQAPLSGQRALTRACLASVGPFAAGFGVEVTLTVRAARAGCSVLEVPTTMRHAATGRDLAGFVHRGRQFIDVARALARLSREGQSPAGTAG